MTGNLCQVREHRLCELNRLKPLYCLHFAKNIPPKTRGFRLVAYPRGNCGFAALLRRTAQPQPSAQEFLRLDRFAVDPPLVIQVRPSRPSGRSDQAYGLPDPPLAAAPAPDPA